MLGHFCDNIIMLTGDKSELFQTTQTTSDILHKDKIEITCSQYD